MVVMVVLLVAAAAAVVVVVELLVVQMVIMISYGATCRPIASCVLPLEKCSKHRSGIQSRVM
jgi:hypothetical protein